MPPFFLIFFNVPCRIFKNLCSCSSVVAAFTRLIDSNNLQFVIELCTVYGLPLCLLPVLKNNLKNNPSVDVDVFHCVNGTRH